MGGGNAQKSAVARARNLALAQKNAGGNSQLADKGKAMTIKCKICMQPFMCTQSEQDLMNHVTGKHVKNTWEDCFDPVYVAAPQIATVYKSKVKAYEGLGVTDQKKGYPKDAQIEEFGSREEAEDYIIETVDYINDKESITYVE
mmetsp:Transcript_63017/g.149378  ORF Transcript_63017/g.149378 Transcript_63017/m.149378 type:complete len:144 (-) Transcript_63017:230-661(-)